MKIAIIGGGISGCAAYLALKKRLPVPENSSEGHEYTIYEAYDTPRNRKSQHTAGETHSATLAVGGGIGVLPNGLNSLKRLDEQLFHDVVRAGYPYESQKLMSSRGGTLMRMPTFSGEPPVLSVSMSRHGLWNCLRARVPDETFVTKRISEVVAGGDGKNIIKFIDGSPDVEADLVIGADGLRSITRKAVFPDDKEDKYPPHYEGVVGIGGFVPAADFKSLIEPSAMALVFGGNGFFGYCYAETDPSAPNRHIPQADIPAGDSVLWWSTYEIAECPDPKTIDISAVQRDLQARHANWKDPVIQKILSKAKVESMYPVWTIPELPTWEKDGVVLVGDAAHALPPTSGQGSSQALEDVEAFSMLLSHCLKQAYSNNDQAVSQGEKEAISRAAKQYMALRKPRIELILEKARQYESKKRDLNKFEEWAMYVGLYIAGLFPAPAWLKQVMSYNIAEEVEGVIASAMN